MSVIFTFVKTVNDVKFEDGVIKSWTTERPSEALEIVRLPVKILKAFISVPTEIVKLHIDLSSEDASLAQKQIAQIEAQKQLAALEKCLEIAEKEDTDALLCFPDEED